jgi:hypothetical protein
VIEHKGNTLKITLHPKQVTALTSSATEILYGGAAGGGKSYLLRIIAIILCMAVPGLQVYLFRRTYPDLMANHMNGSGAFPELIGPLVETKQATLVDGEIRFENGSKIHLCHCQHEKDVLKYQGAEIHVLLIDELTHFTDYIYRFLRNRVRLGGLQVPDQYKHKLPLILSGSNPGSVGHQWVKSTFVKDANPFELRRMPKEEGGMLRQYIPALLTDNPTLTDNDPGYVDRLEGLGHPSLVKAMKDGDWDIVAGAAFEKLSKTKHMIRPFEIPDYWTRFTSMDWGTAKPYAIYWMAVCDDEVILSARDDYPEKHIQRGSIIIYRELYGSNGQADQGTREESWEVARKMALIENEDIDYRIADSAMWAQHDGPSAAENFMDELERLDCKPFVMEKSRKDRAANYLELRNRFAAEDGKQPGIYIFETCTHFWRTVPELQLDEREPEKGWDTRQEDHCIDAVSYGIVSRPMIWTELARDNVAYNQAREKSFSAAKKSKSRY